MNATLTIRADCSSTKGTGHVMRMIALGQAWSETGGTVRFLGDVGPLAARLAAEGFTTLSVPAVHPEPEDLETLLRLTKPGEYIAIDGYHFDTQYQQAIRAAGRKTLVIDDICDREEFVADILLNQNPGAQELAYMTNPDARHLLGTDYALLRREFTRFRRTDIPVPVAASNILVTLGGADPSNLTSRIVQALRLVDNPSFRATIVAGAANPHVQEIRKAMAGLPCPATLLTAVDDMAALMAQADLAVSAAGSTCWELCFFGVPMLLFVVADNQEGIGQALALGGMAVRLDTSASASDIAAALRKLCADRQFRNSMRTRGRRLIDGQGAERVADALRNCGLRLRLAKADDSDLLLTWRNAPSVRANSFSTGSIDPAEHLAWFEKKLADSRTLLFVAENAAGTPVGQIRFDLDGDEAMVSLSVAPNATGRGIGTAMTVAACTRLVATWPKATAVALVKPDNAASARMFRKAGFVLAAPSDPGHLRFEWPQREHE